MIYHRFLWLCFLAAILFLPFENWIFQSHSAFKWLGLFSFYSPTLQNLEHLKSSCHNAQTISNVSGLGRVGIQIPTVIDFDFNLFWTVNRLNASKTSVNVTSHLSYLGRFDSGSKSGKSRSKKKIRTTTGGLAAVKKRAKRRAAAKKSNDYQSCAQIWVSRLKLTS